MPNINKVVYGNTTLIDLSTTTLSQTSQLGSGVTAYARDGSVLTGTGPTLQEKTVTPTTTAIEVVPDDGKVLVVSTGAVIQNSRTITIQATVDLSDLVVGTTYHVVGSGYATNFSVTDNWEVDTDITFSSSSNALTFTHSGSFLYQLSVSSTKIMAAVGSSGDNQLHVTDLSFYEYSGSAYDGLSKVTVNAIPSGTAGTPTATKGSVSNHSISVTPSVTNTTGYITGSTINGTAVTVSASELVSGSETKTSNGTYDVTNLAEIVVNVSSGGGSLVITDVSNASGTTAEISVSGSGGSVQTETGTFVGNDANVITIACDFAPDVIYIRGDLTTSASLRGICSVNIIKDTTIYVTADSSTSASDEYLLFVAHGITGYNTDTTYPYATYSNGILSVDTVMNSGTARWNSSVTYSYKLIGWS